MAQLVKNLPAMLKTQVQSLGWEDPLVKGKATHSSILAWRILWGCQESDMTEQLSFSFILDFGGCLFVFINMVYRWICCSLNLRIQNTMFSFLQHNFSSLFDGSVVHM